MIYQRNIFNILYIFCKRLVKSVKVALSVTLKERAPREEVFSIVLAEAEAIINSRQLSHVSVDPSDPEALTPFHFILDSSSGAPLSFNFENRDLLSQADWKKALRLADHFWNRWVKEYLPILQPRHNHKLNGQFQSYNIGHPVFIADNNLPRGMWSRGRISAVYPGRDEIVRVADVQTNAGTLRRPIRKIVVINTDVRC